MPGSLLAASNFSQILGQPRVSGTRFSKHAEKGPTGFYLITINRCIALASMRQLLNVLTSPPACGEAGQVRGVAEAPCGPLGFMSLPTPHPRPGALMSRCHRDGMVVTAHHTCLRPFPHRIPLIPVTSVSPASPLQTSATFPGCQGCWTRWLWASLW